MDVFNSALRNPLPPLRRKSERHKLGGDSDSPPPLASDSRASDDDSNSRKKKNSRRKHRNSHLGCGTCKKRRIKCDENLPQCFNCVKGKLHCAYLNLDAPARNALRMAQYNQNLRHDRHDDSATKSSKDSELGDEMYRDQGHRASVDAQYYQNYGAYLIPISNGVSGSMNSIPTHPGPTPQLPPSVAASGPMVGVPQTVIGGPAGAAYLQSPYTPIVLFQQVPGMPGYAPVAVQVVPGHPPPQMVYLSDQAPVPIALHPIHMTHAGLDGQQYVVMPNQAVERPMAYDNAIPQKGFPQVPVQVHAPPMAAPGAFPPAVNTFQSSVQIAPPQQPPAGIPASPPTSTASKDRLPPIGALLNPALLKTSPQLPVIRSVLSTHLAQSDSGSKSELEHKLPPIKPESASTLSSAVASPEVADKAPSILKLLS